MAFWRDEVSKRTVEEVFKYCEYCSPEEIRDLVQENLGQNFRKSTIERILEGKYDIRKMGRHLDWPEKTRGGRGGWSNVGGRSGGKAGSKRGSKNGSGADGDVGAKIGALLKGKTSLIIIVVIVVYIFRDQLLDLLIALTPILGALAALAVMGLILKNMLSGKSLFAGKSASGGKSKKSSSSAGKASIGGTVVMIGLLLMALKLLSDGALPAAAISAGLGVFIFKISSR